MCIPTLLFGLAALRMLLLVVCVCVCMSVRVFCQVKTVEGRGTAPSSWALDSSLTSFNVRKGCEATRYLFRPTLEHFVCGKDKHFLSMIA